MDIVKAADLGRTPETRLLVVGRRRLPWQLWMSARGDEP
jgi:hypothetical protein